MGHSKDYWDALRERSNADIARLRYLETEGKRKLLQDGLGLQKLDREELLETYRAKHWGIEETRAKAEIQHERARISQSDLYALRVERRMREEINGIKVELTELSLKELRGQLEDKRTINILKYSDISGLLEGE